MHLKVVILLFFMSYSSDTLAQPSSGGGTFPVYKALGIIKIEEYRYNYKGPSPCDSTPFNVKYFNNKGQMIKEIVHGRHNPYYTYEYNNEGFLVNIDTNGLIGIGHFIPISLKDTAFEQLLIKETWFMIDTMRRLKQTIQFDSISIKTDFTYDDFGKILSEITSYKQWDDRYYASISKLYVYNEMGLLHQIIRKEEDQLINIREFHYSKTN